MRPAAARADSGGTPLPARKDDARRAELVAALTTLDTEALERLLAIALPNAAGSGSQDRSGARSAYLPLLKDVSRSDVTGLRKAERSYGNSWKKRGGVDTFNMLTRKWDRIEKRLSTAVAARGDRAAAAPYDIFEHLAADRATDGLIDDVRDLRRYLTLVEAEVAGRIALGVEDSGRGYLDQLAALSAADVAEIKAKERAYGASWKRRGGIAAFMMLARKWDRIVQAVSDPIAATAHRPGAARENILEHALADCRTEPVLDDVRDLRRYLLLVEAEMAARGVVTIGNARDNKE